MRIELRSFVGATPFACCVELRHVWPVSGHYQDAAVVSGLSVEQSLACNYVFLLGTLYSVTWQTFVCL